MKIYSAAGFALAIMLGFVAITNAQVRELAGPKGLPPFNNKMASSSARGPLAPFGTSTPAGAVRGQLASRVELRTNELTNRLNRTLGQIENLLERTKSRIAKMAAEGKNVAAAQSKVTEAEKALNTAKLSVADLVNKLTGVASSTAPRQMWTAAKANVQSTVQAVKQAHQAVVAVIRTLVPKAGTATSTTPNN